MACEEIEVMLRDRSNDESDQGGILAPLTERPDDILQDGIHQTVLEGVAFLEADKEHPVNEHEPGVFLTALTKAIIRNKSGIILFIIGGGLLNI